jgi:hypothetical protein
VTLLDQARALLREPPPLSAGRAVRVAEAAAWCDEAAGVAPDLARFAVAVAEALPGLRRDPCPDTCDGHWPGGDCWCGAKAHNATLDELRKMLEEA